MPHLPTRKARLRRAKKLLQHVDRENIAEVQDRVVAAARRVGRNPSEITLMAVSKTFPAERIREAYAAGLRVFGENRVQEFADKGGCSARLADAEWHMIGHLQTNKAAKAAELFDAVDSLTRCGWQRN